MPRTEYRIRIDTRDQRRIWGAPQGIPEGSDFNLVAELTVNGVDVFPSSSGSEVLSLRDSTDTSASLILTDAASASTDTTGSVFRATWTITDAVSNGWASDSAILYHGDIRVTDSAALIHYYPVGLLMRSVLD
jgi:hypothetical protein